MDTASIGKVVTMQKFVENLTRYGFKYSNVMNSLILVSPYLPEKFKDCEVEIVFGPRTNLTLVQIKEIKFMEKSNMGYREVKNPDPEFDKYVSNFVQQALRKSMPLHVLQPS